MRESDGGSPSGAGGRHPAEGDDHEGEAGIPGKLLLTLFPFLLVLLLLLLDWWLRGRS